MARQSLHPRARQLERTILRNLTNGNRPALRAVAVVALDHHLPATVARAAAALRYLGGHRHA
jgi:hypothetical protein